MTSKTIKTAAPRYTCIGAVRGACGIMHRSEEAAEACIARDHAGCKSHGGYSDRIVLTVPR